MQTANPIPVPQENTRLYSIWLTCIVASLLAVRILGIIVSPLDLGPDEAQYWRWAQTPAWGYYSKPPLIGWVIGTSTALFGDAEWAVRLPAPILHAVTSLLIFVLGWRMLTPRIGLFAALYYALMPGVILGSGIITTDSVLLPLWAGALLALWTLREHKRPTLSALALGICFGLGMLAKYAMLYFGIGLGLAMLLDSKTRRAFLSPRGALSGIISGLILAPHIMWNLQNELQTISHTVDNANWSGALFHPDHAITFLVDQMAIIGPIGFLVLLFVLYRLVTKHHAFDKSLSQTLRWLACFALPVLVIIFAQAITSRAHANWAATAYITGSLMVSAWFLGNHTVPKPVWWVGTALLLLAAAFIPDLPIFARLIIGAGLAGSFILAGLINKWRSMGLIWVSFSLHGLTALIFTIIAIGPTQWSEKIGLGEAFKRTRGWEESVAHLAHAVQQHQADGLVVDERENWHGIDYYGDRTFPVPVYAWRKASTAKSYSEQADISTQLEQRLLIASVKPHLRPRMRADFTSFDHVGDIEIPIGGNATRNFRLYIATGFDPVERTEMWEQRFQGKQEP